eukprot:3058015-Rhodomonas_salina.1
MTNSTLTGKSTLHLHFNAPLNSKAAAGSRQAQTRATLSVSSSDSRVLARSSSRPRLASTRAAWPGRSQIPQRSAAGPRSEEESAERRGSATQMTRVQVNCVALLIQPAHSERGVRGPCFLRPLVRRLRLAAFEF